MSAADEVRELRALQARAYGREGGLSGAEAERLQDLEARRRAQAGSAAPAGPSTVLQRDPVSVREDGADGGSVGPVGSVSPIGPVGPDDVFPAGRDPSDAATDAAVAVPDSAETGRTARRRRHAQPLIAAAVALLVGVGAGAGVGGFLAAGGADAALELTAEQRAWQDALIAEGDYDPGSIRAVGETADVVAWVATRNDAAQTCLILGDADTRTPSCDVTESVAERGLWATLTLEVSDDLRRDVSAQVLFTSHGEPAAALSLNEYDPGQSGPIYASERETRIAEGLAADGYDPQTIWVAGYDGDTPVWTAQFRETGDVCLIYDAGEGRPESVCADPEILTERAEGLVLERFDEEGVRTRIQMPVGPGASYLVITRDGGASDAAGQ